MMCIFKDRVDNANAVEGEGKGVEGACSGVDFVRTFLFLYFDIYLIFLISYTYKFYIIILFYSY